MNVSLLLESLGSVEPRMSEFLTRFGSQCGLKICANEMLLVGPWNRTCPWMSAGPTLQRALSSRFRFQWRCDDLTHHPESENTCTSVFKKSENAYYSTILFPNFAIHVISQISAATFVRSGSVASTISVIVCVFWIWWFTRTLSFFSSLLKAKYDPTYNRSWTYSKFHHSLRICPTCQKIARCSAHVLDDVVLHVFSLRYWMFEIISMDLLEVMTLVSILFRVFPCCERWFQRFVAYGFPRWTWRTPVMRQVALIFVTLFFFFSQSSFHTVCGKKWSHRVSRFWFIFSCHLKKST